MPTSTQTDDTTFYIVDEELALLNDCSIVNKWIMDPIRWVADRAMDVVDWTANIVTHLNWKSH